MTIFETCLNFIPSDSFAQHDVFVDNVRGTADAFQVKEEPKDVGHKQKRGIIDIEDVAGADDLGNEEAWYP